MCGACSLGCGVITGVVIPRPGRSGAEGSSPTYLCLLDYEQGCRWQGSFGLFRRAAAFWLRSLRTGRDEGDTNVLAETGRQLVYV